MYAANIEMASTLIKHGADSFVKDKEGLTVIDFHRSWAEKRLMAYLKTAGTRK